MRSRAYKILLLKAYLDKGLALTYYFKYFIALFGLASQNVKLTLNLAFTYVAVCFFLGYFWYKYKLIETENEVSNRFNLFVREMRRKRKI